MSERKMTVNAATLRKVVTQMVLRNLGTNVIDRSTLANRVTANILDPVGRNLNVECGYPEHLTIDHYQLLYDRMGIANRVVGVFPDECWSIYPELYETERKRNTAFEKKWREVNAEHHCWHYLHRIDKLSGIGRYGVLLIGVNDGLPLSQPVPGINEDGTASDVPEGRKIIYLRAFTEKLATINSIQNDTSNPRYGQPLMYNLTFSDPNNPAAVQLRNETVHWSRILHIADNRESSEIGGVPRQQSVFNHLLDLRKTYGGSAEMFWKGAFPGYTFETYPDLADEAELDFDSVKEQITDYLNHTQRFLAAVGGKFNSLAPQVADPSKHIEAHLHAICATIGVPIRVFLGSESGHLASTQDAGTWNKRVNQRQRLYIEPMVIQPFINRLVMMGILPQPKQIITSWFDLNTLTDESKADVGLKKAQSLLQYVTSGAELVMPVQHFYTKMLGFTDAEAEALIEEIRSAGKDALITKDLWDPELANELAMEAQAAKDKTKATGASGRRNSLGSAK